MLRIHRAAGNSALSAGPTSSLLDQHANLRSVINPCTYPKSHLSDSFLLSISNRFVLGLSIRLFSATTWDC